MKKLKLLIIDYLMNRSFANDDEIYMYLMSISANIVSLLIHLYLLLLHVIFRVTVVVYFNIFSIMVYLLTFIMVKKRRYLLSGLAICFEVLFYTTCINILCGIENYSAVYYVLIIGFCGIVPFGSQRVTYFIRAACAIAAGISIYFHLMLDPVIPLDRNLCILLLVSNTYIMIFGVMIEFYIVSLARKIIAGLNENMIKELSSQVYIEPLTGLYNRRYAERYFKALSEQSGHVCVAMLDIDDFKQINDTLGHSCGDEVLVYLASFLGKRIRKVDEAFRWGGEEFLLVLNDIRLSEAYYVLDKLRRQLDEMTVPTKQGDIHITVTIGVAKLDRFDVEGSLELSDKNLYDGKRKGKNIVII